MFIRTLVKNKISIILGSDRVIQHITLRGIDQQRLKGPFSHGNLQKDMPAYKCETVEEMLGFYLSCTTYATASNVTVVKKPLSVKQPYPNIFDSFVGVRGNICSKERLDHTGMYMSRCQGYERLFIGLIYTLI